MAMYAQAQAESRERQWQSEVQGLQGKIEKLEGLLQREMGHHQLNSPTPRPVYDLSPAGAFQGCRVVNPFRNAGHCVLPVPDCGVFLHHRDGNFAFTSCAARQPVT